MRLAISADLHWGLDPQGDAATRALARKANELEPDVFALAGDIGEGEAFPRCLDLFEHLTCPRVLVPGNHDVWTRAAAPHSLELYLSRLPQLALNAGFQYLDQQPFLSTAGGPALVGSMNWYDYSFADLSVEDEFPDARRMYREKHFPQGAHNDGRFVQFGLSDEDFTQRVVSNFQRQLADLPASVDAVISIQHHPPVRELFYPTPLTTTYQRFWLAYTGNRRMQDAVLSDPRVQTVICGHTHAACEATVSGKRCLNIGGDYHFKRLLLLDTKTGIEQWWEFR